MESEDASLIQRLQPYLPWTRVSGGIVTFHWTERVCGSQGIGLPINTADPLHCERGVVRTLTQLRKLPTRSIVNTISPAQFAEKDRRFALRVPFRRVSLFPSLLVTSRSHPCSTHRLIAFSDATSQRLEPVGREGEDDCTVVRSVREKVFPDVKRRNAWSRASTSTLR